jgi:8-oxo-dGTP diphosphatase
VRSARVVAAVIRRDGRILVSLRKAGGERGGRWELPGGKVEPGEGEPEALVREIREELGCEVFVGPLLCRHRHRYDDLDVELAFYECRLQSGDEPRCLVAEKLEWAPSGSLSSYDFCEADREAMLYITSMIHL